MKFIALLTLSLASLSLAAPSTQRRQIGVTPGDLGNLGALLEDLVASESAQRRQVGVTPGDLGDVGSVEALLENLVASAQRRQVGVTGDLLDDPVGYVTGSGDVSELVSDAGLPR